MKTLRILNAVVLSLLFISCSDDESDSPQVLSDDPVQVYQEAKQLIDLTKQLSSTSTAFVPSDFSNPGSSFRKENSLCDLLGSFEIPSEQACISFSLSCSEDESLITEITYADGCTQAGQSLSGKISILTEKPFVFDKEEIVHVVTYEDLKIREGIINGMTTLKSDLTAGTSAANWVSISEYSIQKINEKIMVNSTDTLTSIIGDATSPTMSINNVTFTASSSLGYQVSGHTTKEIVATSNCKIDDTIDIFFPVSGTQKIVVTGLLGRSHDYTLDYGDGTCDDQYTVTDQSGNVRTFDLRDDTEIVQ